jgi:hypothetical protein
MRKGGDGMRMLLEFLGLCESITVVSYRASFPCRPFNARLGALCVHTAQDQHGDFFCFLLCRTSQGKGGEKDAFAYSTCPLSFFPIPEGVGGRERGARSSLLGI